MTRRAGVAGEASVDAGTRARVHALAESWLALAGILVLAAVVRFAQLGFQSLTDDEGYSVGLAQRSFADMLGLFRWEGNGTLYSVVLWPLVRLSDSLDMLRAPAALAGVAAVAATYWAGRELATRRVALVGAALLAVSPMAVRYSQFARPFSFVILFSALSVALLARHLRTGDSRALAGYAVVLALLTYSNNLGPILLVPVHVLLVAPAGRAALRRLAIAIAGAGVLAAPVIALGVVESGRRDPLYWLSRPDVHRIADVVEEFMIGRAETSAWDVRAASVLGLLAAGALVLAHLRRSRGLEFSVTPLFAWTFLPVALALAISVVRPVFFGAYLVMVLPGLCLLLASGAARLPARSSAGVLGVLVLAWGTGVVAMARPPHVLDYRSAGAFIADHRQPADPLVVELITTLPAYSYYDPALRAPDGNIVVKEWGDEPMPAGVTGFTDPGGYGDAPAGPPSAAYVRGLAQRTGRVVFVVSSTIGQGDVEHGAAATWLRQHCQVVDKDFGDIVVLAARGCRSPGA